jgi:hypothetical protein
MKREFSMEEYLFFNLAMIKYNCACVCEISKVWLLKKGCSQRRPSWADCFSSFLGWRAPLDPLMRFETKLSARE